MMIDRVQIEKIKKIIADEYPEFKGVEPKVTRKDISPQEDIYAKLKLGVPKQLRHLYRLKFATVVETEDNVSMDRILMVTLDENLEIVKIIQSR